MIQQVFNSEQKAQLQIQLSNQPELKQEIAALRARDEELENQILAYQKQQASTGASPSVAEPSAQQAHAQAYEQLTKNEQLPNSTKGNPRHLLEARQ
ncbi:unnamed protein product [Cuscuta europaea]|uniref:Uncharacterized protein n=1 Tax=Cuscuta europaea TaxID=41803 RepID=A0A9P0ZRP9_CUSEU|nr:unnamed protein product [Cuscuta europaea]